ncbi:hypothetical protein C2S52_015512 [Perilla frutescens var. hirtella]|nr:hypothetical protein C2S52_015512 [Perilla frutescens var. hirtella]KAH6815671.1 hypothetical protein C2S51_020491 [Perilla frutescens var. frutescens]
MAREMSSSSKFVLIKACVRLVLLLGVLGFLIIGSHGNGVRNREASGRIRQDFVEAVPMMINRKHRLLSKLELNYISKRKVPNGPDPIHNRGAGKSHRPPGHA